MTFVTPLHTKALFLFVKSTGTTFEAEKSPARSRSVGTIDCSTVDVVCRSPAYEPKKKVLSLRTGPPRVKPNWFRCNGLRLATFHGLAFSASSRQNSNT